MEHNINDMNDWFPVGQMAEPRLLSSPPTSPTSSLASTSSCCSPIAPSEDSSRRSSMTTEPDDDDDDDDFSEEDIFVNDSADPEWKATTTPTFRRQFKTKTKVRRSSSDSSSSDNDEYLTRRGNRRCRRRMSSSSSTSSCTQVMPKAKITVWLAKLLDSPAHNPRVVQWENRERKIFRINDQEELARLWGQAKGNPEMTYEKFRYT